MSDRPDAAATAAACSPSPHPRAARLAKFKREQLIVDYLNRGVSVPEIAARIGVGEKRMRAIIRDILARRMPQPPMEFVAIQLSRLNEALLVAYSAMSPSNLKAVDQVVKIVRELDRYGGASAAEWARPHTSPRITVRGLDAPAEEDAAFARAWLCGDEPAPPDAEADADRVGLERPQDPAQASENVNSAPGNWTGAKPSDGPPDAETAPIVLSPSKDIPSLSKDAPVNAEGSVPGSAERPENPAQASENVKSAPGNGTGRDDFGRPDPDAAPRANAEAGAVPASDGRPENPTQGLENMESAPGLRNSAEDPAVLPRIPLPTGLRRAA